MAKQEIRGCILEEENGKIVSFSPNHGINPEITVRIGQRVISNGRLVRKGIWGTVVAIHEPHRNGKTSDVIEVQWRNTGFTVMAKTKDLFFSSCRCRYCRDIKINMCPN